MWSPRAHDDGADRRVGLGKDGELARDHRAVAGHREGHRLDSVRGAGLVGLPDRILRRYRGGEIAMVFQDPSRSLNPTIRIGPQITEAIQLHCPLSDAQAVDRAVELMELVRLPGGSRTFPAVPASAVGRDAPARDDRDCARRATPSCWSPTRRPPRSTSPPRPRSWSCSGDLQQRLGMALIMISHDLALAASFADEVLVMYAGRGVERAPTRKLFAHVRMPYTRALLGAIPAPGEPVRTPRCRRCRASRPTSPRSRSAVRSRRAAPTRPTSAASRLHRSKSRSPSTGGRAGIPAG